jgi:glycerophosphoryl diester phosphodiesterase
MVLFHYESYVTYSTLSNCRYSNKLSVHLQLFMRLAHVALLIMIANPAAHGTEHWKFPRVIAHRGGGKLAPGKS